MQIYNCMPFISSTDIETLWVVQISFQGRPDIPISHCIMVGDGLATPWAKASAGMIFTFKNLPFMRSGLN